MSAFGQRPEHLLIRDFVTKLRDDRRLTQEGLRDAFVPVYLEMIPPGDGVPHFEMVHRHDSVDQMRRKNDANLKKLWRALDGTTSFPLAFRLPLIEALNHLHDGMGTDLQKELLHNAGLCHLPIDTGGKAPAVYADFLKEFAEANSQIVADFAKDGVLNESKSRRELLDSIDKHLVLLRELDLNESNAQKVGE